MGERVNGESSSQPIDLAADFDPSRPGWSYLQIIRQLLVNPKGFYQAMPEEAGYGRPALFALISFVIPGLILALISSNGLAALVYPLFMAGGWLLYVLLIHLAVTRLLSGQARFQATFRAAAYATFTNLASFLPLLGIAAQIFGLYLTGQGLAVVHRLQLRQTILALAIVMLGLLAGNLLMIRAVLPWL